MHALIAMTDRAVRLEREDRLVEASDIFEDLLARLQPELVVGHWLTTTVMTGYGVCLRRQGRHGEAEVALLRAVEVASNVFGRRNARTVAALRALVDLYEAWGRPDQRARWQARL